MTELTYVANVLENCLCMPVKMYDENSKCEQESHIPSHSCVRGKRQLYHIVYKLIV